MNFMLAISEDRVPSTKEPDPYMHLFLDAGNGNILAFFELPNSPTMGRDQNTPQWVQHIAFQLENEQALLQAKADLQANGIEVLGPTDHGIIKSIYLFDPNGHRLELTTVTASPDQLQKLDDVKWDMLEEWTKSKSTVKQANWLHAGEFSKA
jgi:catechol-2,3-dioxygenase